MNINSIVRRLCPVETERLMHFPDNYLHIDGDATPDSPMYKGCGNSWGVNNARWANLRLEFVLRDTGLVANDRVVQYATTCSGVEAHTLSVKGQNWHANFYSEIEPFPCRVLAHHYPDTPNLGDMTKLDGHPYSLDVFSGGTPCFTAGNMVLTESGYRPIETIREGDMVMTHEGRLRKVVAIGAKMAHNIVDVTIATRQKIRCTADHKFWAAVRPHRDFRRHADTFLKVQFDGMSFQPISKVGVGGYVAQLSEYETMPLPKMPKVYNASDADILELAGWYVGDGHCAGFSNTRHKKVLVLSLSESKVENFRSRFNGVVNFTAYPHDKNGVYRVQVACAELCDWLVENFGHLSHNKNIPAWLIASTDENRQSFLEGYMATDGYSSQQARLSFACSSTSYALALGIADLVGKCAVYKANVPPTKEMYDGRIVNQRPFWTVRRSTKPNRFHDYGKWSGVRVREIRERCPEVVYNITVEDDHSYIVNGLCVSNCQSVSVAGKRHGMAEGSGTRSSLAYHWLRIGNEAVRPGGVLLWENVPGALSSGYGYDFMWFIHRLNEEGYAVAWRVMDMQWLAVDTAPRAVPQRRRRIWLIAQKGSDWRIPARVLFERASRLGTVHPNRIVDGRIIRSEEDEAAAAFDLFGGNEPTFNHDSRADMIPFSEMPGKGDDFLTLSDISLVDFFRKVGTIQYVGGILAGEHEEPVRDQFGAIVGYQKHLGHRLEDNIGNAGCAVGGRVVTLKIPEWSAGIQLPYGAECPAEYDGTVCGLSDVLLPMTDDLLGYILSPRACTGILRRADKRGKKLPEPLELALHEQIANWACGAFGDAVKADAKDEAEEANAEPEEVDGNPVVRNEFGEIVSPEGEE